MVAHRSTCLKELVAHRFADATMKEIAYRGNEVRICGGASYRGWLVVMAIRALALREAQYGQTATPEQVMEAGNSCAICHEQMKSPIRLHCNHCAPLHINHNPCDLS